MPRFYNREPWNLIIGLSVLSGGFLAIAIRTTLWLLVVPVALVAFFKLKFWVVRAIALRTKGYFAGRRIHTTWIYEEIQGPTCKSLMLPVAHTEPFHYEIFFPDQSGWRESVPEWAWNRREEITTRIAHAWKASDVHFSE